MLPYPTAEDDDFDKLESTLSQVAFTIGTASLTDCFLERKFDNFSSIHSCIKFEPVLRPILPGDHILNIKCLESTVSFTFYNWYFGFSFSRRFVFEKKIFSKDFNRVFQKKKFRLLKWWKMVGGQINYTFTRDVHITCILIFDNLLEKKNQLLN